eukprot:scaffold23157_cov57-Phaeocystis_antarctica.AAC.1
MTLSSTEMGMVGCTDSASSAQKLSASATGDPRRHRRNGFVPGDGAPKPHAQAARAEQRAEGDGGDAMVSGWIAS